MPRTQPDIKDQTPNLGESLRLEATDKVLTDDDSLSGLIHHYRRGVSVDGEPGSREGRLPVHFAPYLNLTQVRIAYPALLLEEESASVRPLTGIIDDLLARVEGDGDDDERLRRDVLKIERIIRQMAPSERHTPLGELFDTATSLVIRRSNGTTDRISKRQEAIESIKHPFPEHATLLTCSVESVERLFTAQHRSWKSKSSESFRAELNNLIERLDQTLVVDESHAPEKKDAEHLEASVGPGGADDIDADALSGLLASVSIDSRLPEERRDRIASALDDLKRLTPVILGSADSESSESDPSLTFAASADQARDLLKSNTRKLVTFFAAFHTARLEVDNRYLPDTHDALFDNFGWSDLNEGDKRLCPPVFLKISNADLGGNTGMRVLDLLSTGLPVRILLLSETIGQFDDIQSDRINVSSVADRLALTATSTGSAFVMQTALSDLHTLVEGIGRGVAYPGPSLFSVYTGSEGHSPDLPAYLRAAAAVDGRAVPSFTFDPSRGAHLATQWSLTGNSEPEADWPSATIEFDTDGDTQTQEIRFTAAEFFACDDRFDAHFRYIPADKWHERMRPAGDLVDQVDDNDTAVGIPYVLLTGPDGVARRYILTYSVMKAARELQKRWHMLQEFGDIRNSYVDRHIEEEIERLAEEKQRESEEVEKRHQKELSQATEAVAENIISNLAARLLGLSSAQPADTDFGAPVSKPTGPSDSEAPTDDATAASASTVESGKQDAPAEDDSSADDEPLLMEEAYIDTPLCTSCNECTNLNGQIFAYDDNKQAYIKDASAGPFKDLVVAAEMCPVRIIHPGKPQNPDEPNLDELIERAEKFN